MILEQKLSRAIIRLIICIRRLLFRHVHRVNIFIRLFFVLRTTAINKKTVQRRRRSAQRPTTFSFSSTTCRRLPTLESMVTVVWSYPRRPIY